MQDKKIVSNEQNAELNDEQLDKVAGGIFIRSDG